MVCENVFLFYNNHNLCIYFFTYSADVSLFFDIEFSIYNASVPQCHKCKPKTNILLEYIFNVSFVDTQPLYMFYNFVFFK
jgi:hypothetical protein